MTIHDPPAPCPTCRGKGTLTIHLSGFRGEQRASWWRTEECGGCGGTGTIPAAQLASIERGRQMRDDRVARGVSQREEAATLGITPQQLARMEHGRE